MVDNDNPATMPGDQPRPIIIDSEHFAIRLLVPVLTVLLVIMIHLTGTWILSRLFGDDSNPICVMLIVDVIVFLAGGYVSERALKRALPSRRSASLSADQLIVTDARNKPPSIVTIDWHRTVNVKAWRFEVTRATRIPKGWYCMALQLLQDDDDTIFYTFMPPEEAETVVGYTRFLRLRPRKETESNNDLSAAAEQRRLLTLEDARWTDGAEIAKEDFKAVLAVLQRTVPGWI